MTKEELEQYRSSEFPYIRHVMSVSGVTETEDNKRDMMLIRKLECKKREIEAFIHSIPDSVMRRICTYRYIDGIVRPSWQWIAFKIGHYDESYPRRKHNKFLNKS